MYIYQNNNLMRNVMMRKPAADRYGMYKFARETKQITFGMLFAFH